MCAAHKLRWRGVRFSHCNFDAPCGAEEATRRGEGGGGNSPLSGARCAVVKFCALVRRTDRHTRRTQRRSWRTKRRASTARFRSHRLRSRASTARRLTQSTLQADHCPTLAATRHAVPRLLRLAGAVAALRRPLGVRERPSRQPVVNVRRRSCCRRRRRRRVVVVVVVVVVVGRCRAIRSLCSSVSTRETWRLA